MRSIGWRPLTAAAMAAALLSSVHAQQPPSAPMPAQANPYCGRLEAQLAAFDRSAGDAARGEQIRKLEQSAASQQAELDRQEAAARRAGCERNNFFMLFSGQQAQCTPLNNKVQQLRDNLERIQGDIEQSRADIPPEREGQRRAIILALAQNNCGAQYQQQVSAPPPPCSGGLFESLFGPRTTIAPSAPESAPGLPVPSGTYRTICVRTCDGYYFPISYAASPARFAEDEKTCHQSCPAAETQLFTYRTSGEDVNQAVSANGQQPYTSLPNAFRYRTSLDKTCSCRQPGASWAETLKGIDDGTVEQGDIVVNEQRARQLSQPRVDAQGKPIKLTPSAPARAAQQPTAAATAGTPAPALSADAATPGDPPVMQADPNRKIRSVGPTFIPAR